MNHGHTTHLARGTVLILGKDERCTCEACACVCEREGERPGV